MPILRHILFVVKKNRRLQGKSGSDQLGANAFLVQPVEFESFVQLLQMLEYWLRMTKAPQVPGPIPIALAPTTNPQSLPPSTLMHPVAEKPLL